MTWLIDLDGVVWTGARPIDGSAKALGRLAALNEDVVFVTNNSALSAEGYTQKMAAMGIRARATAVVHGGHAVARLVKPGQRVLVCAGEGVVEAVQAAGAHVERGQELKGVGVLASFDAVVVGWLPDFSYDLLSSAVRAVLGGAALLAPSADPLYPAEDGPKIGGGALTTAVAYATGATPQFAAKPFPPMIEAVAERVPRPHVVIGDQAMTDGGLAEALGVPFIHVATGVGAPSSTAVRTVTDLTEAVDWFLENR